MGCNGSSRETRLWRVRVLAYPGAGGKEFELDFAFAADDLDAARAMVEPTMRHRWGTRRIEVKAIRDGGKLYVSETPALPGKEHSDGD